MFETLNVGLSSEHRRCIPASYGIPVSFLYSVFLVKTVIIKVDNH